MTTQSKAITVLRAALLALAVGAASPTLFAHTGATHDKPKTLSTEEKAFGKQGVPKNATRTIRIAMYDNMRFEPANISVRQGETIKFVVTNKGKLMHEIVLGTMDELNDHSNMMKKYPGMEHDEPYMAHVAPGRTAVMVWQFTQAGEFHYACLIPGHFEAGMTGKITVRKNSM